MRSTFRIPRSARPIVLLGVWLGCATVSAEDVAERVTFRQNGEALMVAGRVLVEAQDGGILLLGRDGRLWNVLPDELQSRETTSEAFTPFSPEELGSQLQSELGEGFTVHQSRHYVLCTNAGTLYAEWCGSLFDRLYAAFETHWHSRDLRLTEPELPLGAILFATRKQFAEYAAKDVGPEMAEALGYYSVRTNRMVLFDLTADEGEEPARTPADITRKLAESPLNVATIVHEATHQIAFNRGLHVRYADNPLWLSEGMAMYFETPDLTNRSGWRTVGQVNRGRLARFRDFARNRRAADSLQTLIASDERFTNAETAADAYAEAWALSYFLIKTRRRQYVEYLNRIARKPRLVWDTPEERWAEFQEVFGDTQRLEQEFLRHAARLR